MQEDFQYRRVSYYRRAQGDGDNDAYQISDLSRGKTTDQRGRD